ncbi:hypothetical protein FQN54_007844 [Arachnomyces sp. PD_36]|nr:hypothetical protein FQN54_007844 [Arachnomyces sp. PD_36]
MSDDNPTPLQTALRAERDLNSYQAKTGTGQVSDTTTDSGIDAGVQRKFPSSTLQYGDAATTGAGDHKTIPPEEGGEYDDRGHISKAKEFEGPGGPEDKAKIEAERRPGDQDTATEFIGKKV